MGTMFRSTFSVQSLAYFHISKIFCLHNIQHYLLNILTKYSPVISITNTLKFSADNSFNKQHIIPNYTSTVLIEK